jgi:ferredoxin-NADP reductase
MLRYIREERILRSDARIVLHYLVRQREETLFTDVLSEIKGHLGNRFDCHLWITRQENPSTSSLPSINFELHARQAAMTDQVGQKWEWWNSFLDDALEHFDTENNRDKSLVYICGPQGLTDRLVEIYKDRGLMTEDGHVQVEKWW